MPPKPPALPLHTSSKPYDPPGGCPSSVAQAKELPRPASASPVTSSWLIGSGLPIYYSLPTLEGLQSGERDKVCAWVPPQHTAQRALVSGEAEEGGGV